MVASSRNKLFLEGKIVVFSRDKFVIEVTNGSSLEPWIIGGSLKKLPIIDESKGKTIILQLLIGSSPEHCHRQVPPARAMNREYYWTLAEQTYPTPSNVKWTYFPVEKVVSGQ